MNQEHEPQNDHLMAPKEHQDLKQAQFEEEILLRMESARLGNTLSNNEVNARMQKKRNSLGF